MLNINMDICNEVQNIKVLLELLRQRRKTEPSVDAPFIPNIFTLTRDWSQFSDGVEFDFCSRSPTRLMFFSENICPDLIVKTVSQDSVSP